jgi:hypothetical protein
MSSRTATIFETMERAVGLVRRIVNLAALDGACVLLLVALLVYVVHAAGSGNEAAADLAYVLGIVVAWRLCPRKEGQSTAFAEVLRTIAERRANSRASSQRDDRTQTGQGPSSPTVEEKQNGLRAAAISG